MVVLTDMIEEAKKDYNNSGIKGIVEGAKVAFYITHAFPTINRRADGDIGNMAPDRFESVIGFVFTLAIECCSYLYISTEMNHPEVLGIPVLTQLASYTYELYRKVKEKN